MFIEYVEHWFNKWYCSINVRLKPREFCLFVFIYRPILAAAATKIVVEEGTTKTKTSVETHETKFEGTRWYNLSFCYEKKNYHFVMI